MALNFKAYIMESLGVFALCYIGGMAAAYPGAEKGLVALAHMLALGILIYVGAATSGANYNPAVSLALLLTKNLGCVDCLFYILFQFIGGFMGGFLVWGIGSINKGGPVVSQYCNTYPSFPTQAASTVESSGQYSARIFQACFAEFFATFFLVFMVFATAVDKRNAGSVYGMAIGGAVGMSALGIGSITGGAMNPMRWLGPWIVGGWGCKNSTQSGWGWLVYGVFTNLGGITAGLMYNMLFLSGQN